MVQVRELRLLRGEVTKLENAKAVLNELADNTTDPIDDEAYASAVKIIADAIAKHGPKKKPT